MEGTPKKSKNYYATEENSFADFMASIFVQIFSEKDHFKLKKLCIFCKNSLLDDW